MNSSLKKVLFSFSFNAKMMKKIQSNQEMNKHTKGKDQIQNMSLISSALAGNINLLIISNYYQCLFLFSIS